MMFTILREQAQAYRGPPMTLEELLERLRKAGNPHFCVGVLRSPWFTDTPTGE